LPKRIVLTGFMGAGKSALGPLVAQHLGWKFLDLDDEIVRAEQKSIAEIFDSGGEAHFRELEQRTLVNALKLERVVLALGGGTLETEANRQLLQKDQGTLLLYLAAPLEVLIARCEQQQMERKAVRRPILEKGAELMERFQRRRPLYELADWTLETTGQTLNQLVECFLARWKNAPWNSVPESQERT
jgi:shikimate kinase